MDNDEKVKLNQWHDPALRQVIEEQIRGKTIRELIRSRQNDMPSEDYNWEILKK